MTAIRDIDLVDKAENVLRALRTLPADAKARILVAAAVLFGVERQAAEIFAATDVAVRANTSGAISVRKLLNHVQRRRGRGAVLRAEAMTWLYLPSECCPSAPESALSTSVSPSPSPDPKLWATSSGKPVGHATGEPGQWPRRRTVGSGSHWLHERQLQEQLASGISRSSEGPTTDPFWPPGPSDHEGWLHWAGPQPVVHRAVDGTARGLDGLRWRAERLQALGNSVVPLAAAAAFLGLARRVMK